MMRIIFFPIYFFNCSLRIVISVEDQVFRDISLKVMFVILVIALFFMGLKVDVKITLEVLKKPIGPLIGMFSQFLFMPLCSYGLAKGLLLNGNH